MAAPTLLTMKGQGAGPKRSSGTESWDEVHEKVTVSGRLAKFQSGNFYSGSVWPAYSSQTASRL